MLVCEQTIAMQRIRVYIDIVCPCEQSWWFAGSPWCYWAARFVNPTQAILEENIGSKDNNSQIVQYTAKWCRIGWCMVWCGKQCALCGKVVAVYIHVVWQLMQRTHSSVVPSTSLVSCCWSVLSLQTERHNMHNACPISIYHTKISLHEVADAHPINPTPLVRKLRKWLIDHFILQTTTMSSVPFVYTDDKQASEMMRLVRPLK